MKKIFLFLLIVLTIFALASCKQDPRPADKTPDSTPGDSTPATPTKPEIIEPAWETGVLRVKSGEEAENEAQPNKFQFALNKSVNAGQAIQFLAKFTSNASKFTVRQGVGDYTRFISDTVVDTFSKTEDGWYIVEVPAEGVLASSTIAFTLYVDAGTWESSFIAIKDLYIGGEVVDLTELDEDADILPFVKAPTELDVLIVKSSED